MRRREFKRDTEYVDVVWFMILLSHHLNSWKTKTTTVDDDIAADDDARPRVMLRGHGAGVANFNHLSAFNLHIESSSSPLHLCHRYSF